MLLGWTCNPKICFYHSSNGINDIVTRKRPTGRPFWYLGLNQWCSMQFHCIILRACLFVDPSLLVSWHGSADRGSSFLNEKFSTELKLFFCKKLFLLNFCQFCHREFPKDLEQTVLYFPKTLSNTLSRYKRVFWEDRENCQKLLANMTWKRPTGRPFWSDLHHGFELAKVDIQM